MLLNKILKTALNIKRRMLIIIFFLPLIPNLRYESSRQQKLYKGISCASNAFI